jgi:hypothetical protein
MADAIERNAEPQNRYREVNERVAEVYSQHAAGDEADTPSGLFELLCECGQQAPCGERVSVDRETYERVRSDPTTDDIHPLSGT